MRRLLKILVLVVGVYLLVLAGIFFLMLQPPLVFARAISKVPARALFTLFPFKPLWSVARAGSLKVGDEAPDFKLLTRDTKEEVILSSFRGRKPVVLVFGSYTWPPFRREVPALNKLYQRYKNNVAFYVVYIEEAHASDMWQMSINVRENVIFANPSSFEERTAVANTCVKDLGIEFPAVIDDFSNSAERAYTGWPDRLYVVDRDGRIAWKSKPGPYGFRPADVAATLERLVPLP